MKYNFKIEGNNVNCLLDTGASSVFVRKSVVTDLLNKNVQLKLYKLGNPPEITYR